MKKVGTEGSRDATFLKFIRLYLVENNNYKITMKTKLFLAFTFAAILMTGQAFAEDEERKVPSFSEILLRVPATLHLEQGSEQSLEIVAKPSTLEEIISEVKGGKLSIKFPNKNYLWKKFNPGKIEIFITVPEINAISLSGSGKIIAEDEIQSRIFTMASSGSGDIVLESLDAERVEASMSGSGNITIKNGGIAEDLSVQMSGSGNFKGEGFEATDVVVRIAGSGNCSITTNGSIKARIAGSGNVNYYGNPRVDSSVAGSGKVKKM